MKVFLHQLWYTSLLSSWCVRNPNCIDGRPEMTNILPEEDPEYSELDGKTLLKIYFIYSLNISFDAGISILLRKSMEIHFDKIKMNKRSSFNIYYSRCKRKLNIYVQYYCHCYDNHLLIVGACFAAHHQKGPVANKTARNCLRSA